MNLHIKKLVIFTFLTLLSLFSAALLNADTPREANTLRIGIHTFPISLNPVYATDETSLAIINKIFDSLYYFDPSGHIKKGLAAHETIKQNGAHLEVIIQLKRGMFFPDGKELEALDVVRTVNLLRDPAFKYPYRSGITWIRHIKTLGRYRFLLRLSKAAVTWRNQLTFKIMDGRQLVNADTAGFRRQILAGTGPYHIRRVKEPAKILLALNPGADAGRMFPFLEFIVVAYTQLAPLKILTGEIDICELQPENVRAYRHIPRWQRSFDIIKYKKFGFTYLVFNLKNSRITRNIRRLFYNLLVGGDFTRRFLNGRGEVLTTPFLLLNKDIEPEAFTTVPPRKPLTLSTLCNSESKLRKEFCLFLKQALKPMGIILEPIFLDYHTFLDNLKNRRFDIAVSAFILDIGMDMREVLHSEAPMNYSGFQDHEMDRLLDLGPLEPGPGKREAIYSKAHHTWLNHLPFLPLFNLYYYVGISHKKVNVPTDVYKLVGSSGDFLFNIRQWRVKNEERKSGRAEERK
jgi:peptide/nickel transport system substrate-binding protein